MKLNRSFPRFYLEFIMAMTEKEIKARYKHALLGLFWVIINPLIQMIVLGLIFRIFIPIKVDNYFVYLFAGLLPWNFLAESLSKCTPSIVYERSLIKKAHFPRESIVLSIILSNLFHFTISLLLFSLILLVISAASTPLVANSLTILKIITMPILIIVFTMFISGISLITSALNVKYRDVNFIVKATLPLWFYATPIIYNLDLVPTHLHAWFYFNPMTAIIESFHWILINHPPALPSHIVISFSISILVTIIGWIVFRRASPTFDDWV